MGGAVSAGKDNDELVDNLCFEGYITTPEVEAVFRMIDRQKYLKIGEDDDPLEAYEDHAWRRGNLHLSAPCIYSRVMEALKFRKGLSFLNIGSGTGYLSTMAGLILGPTGINHGIELYSDNVEYAYEKLHEFQMYSPWYDPLSFCEPSFVEGNALLLSPNGIMYDRVYCGAGCPTEHAQLLKNMLRVGGVLVVPQDSELEALTRVSEDRWETEVVLPTVSFAPLILPSAISPQDMTAIEMSSEVKDLKKLCGLAVLKALGRERYHLISSLPLPSHLIQLISHNREWKALPDPVKILCPIDRKSEMDEGEGNEEGAAACASKPRLGRRRRGRGPDGDREYSATVAPSILNGRRVLLVSMEGLFMPIPMDSDQDDEEDEDLQEAAEAMSSNADTDCGSDRQQEEEEEQQPWQEERRRRKRGRLLHQLFSRRARAAVMESSSSGNSEDERDPNFCDNAGRNNEDDCKMELVSEEVGPSERYESENSLSGFHPHSPSHVASHSDEDDVKMKVVPAEVGLKVQYESEDSLSDFHPYSPSHDSAHDSSHDLT